MSSTQDVSQSNDQSLAISMPGEDGFGPKELAATLAANWITLVLFIAIGLMAAATYLYVAKPMYRTSSTVLIETKNNAAMTMAYGDAGGVFGMGQTLAEIEIMTSQVVLSRVVKDLKADILVAPRQFPVIGEAIARRDSSIGPLLAKMPGLRRYVWSKTVVSVPGFDVPPTYEEKTFSLRSHEGGKYDLLYGERLLIQNAVVGQPLTVVLDEQTGGELRVFVSEMQAPAGAQFSLKKLQLTSAVGRLKNSLDVEENPRGSGVVRITAVSDDRQQAMELSNGVATAYLRQNVERRSAEAAQTLAFLKSQLPTVQNRVQAAEGALNGYRLRNSSVDLAKETDFVLDQSAELERKRNELQQKRAELMITLTAAHPSVKAIDIQLERLSGQVGRLQKEIAKLPETQQELLTLTREVEVNTRLYTEMLNNMQQLEVAEAGTLGNVRIIDQAPLPGGAFKPRSTIILVAGMIFGLAAALVVLVLMHLLDHAEHDPTVIERLAGVPVYATIPFSQIQQKLVRGRSTEKAAGTGYNQLLVAATPQDPASESIRSLRTTLHFSVFESGRKSVMFTGPTPGIGKSFVTANLAAVLAQVPMKVILIDADLRRGTIHDYYGLKRNKGVSNYILGASLDDIMQPSGIPGLNIVSTGEVPPNPSELLMSPRFAALIAEAESVADMVLVDSGPILAVTDAGIIGRVVGGTLMIFKAGQHTGREITDSVKRLLQVGVRVRGLVINQVGHRRGYGYYAYGKYGYYYNYKYSSKN